MQAATEQKSSAKHGMGWFIGFLLSVVTSIAPGLASAGPTTCMGPLANSTVNGDLVVPPGATCTLDHVRITGNVTVQTNAALFVTTFTGLDTTVGGNITANGCNGVDLESTGATGRIAVGGSL